MAWLVPAFNSAHPNIKLISNAVPDSIESQAKIQSACAAGECPEIIHEANFAKWESGFLLDLKPYVEADPAWKERWIPEIFELQLDMADGVLWGIPAESYLHTAMWNTETLKKGGVDSPAMTWDEWVDAAVRLKENGAYLTGGIYGTGAVWDSMLYSQPGAADALVNKQWDNEYVRNVLARIKEMADAELFPPDAMELGWDGIVPLFHADKLGVVVNGPWHIGNAISCDDCPPETEPKVQVTPIIDSGQGTCVLTRGTGQVGLAAKLKDDQAKLDAALEFLKFWCSEEAVTQWAILSQSPMGMKVGDLPEDKVRLLAEVLQSAEEADNKLVPPFKLEAMRNQWDWWNDAGATTVLFEGGSVDDAVAEVVDYWTRADEEATR
jgi:ABC-type glycerol-3-phosphate transport system substrate-binding protein